MHGWSSYLLRKGGDNHRVQACRAAPQTGRSISIHSIVYGNETPGENPSIVSSLREPWQLLVLLFTLFKLPNNPAFLWVLLRFVGGL